MNLESLERVLTAYKATLYDLADLMALQRGEDREPSDAELLRSLTEAIRRVERLPFSRRLWKRLWERGELSHRGARDAAVAGGPGGIGADL